MCLRHNYVLGIAETHAQREFLNSCACAVALAGQLFWLAIPTSAGMWFWTTEIRSGVLEDVLGLEDVLEDTFWSHWPWPRSLKSLASKSQVLENCPVLGSRTAGFFEQLKFRYKTSETLQKICEHLFCFPYLEHRRRQRGGGRVPPQLAFHQWQKCNKKPYCFFSFSFFLAFFDDNSITS